MITLEAAKQLCHGEILHHVSNKNADGTPQRWRVNGKPKTWKRSLDRVHVPLKHGMYDFGYLTEGNLAAFDLQVNDDCGEEWQGKMVGELQGAWQAIGGDVLRCVEETGGEPSCDRAEVIECVLDHVETYLTKADVEKLRAVEPKVKAKLMLRAFPFDTYGW